MTSRNKIGKYGERWAEIRSHSASIFRGTPPPPGQVADGHLPTEMRAV
jgi:hypothetical protein